MLASSSLTILLSAAAVMANPHAGRSHSAIAKRLESSNNTFTLGKRTEQFTNKEMTWYPTDTGADACTGKNHQDSDFFVAMGYTQFGQGGCCGKQMRITANGKTATATCVDECASCPQYGQIDLTKGLFKYFTDGDLDVGVIYGSWSYVDGSDDGGDGGNDDTTTKTTHKATPTPPPPPPPAPTTHHTTTSTPKPKPKPTSTQIEVVVHSSSKKASSSAKPSSSARPSSSSVHSSSAQASSSSKVVVKPSSSSSASPVPTPNQGVANAGSNAGSSSDSGDGADQISGAIGTGSEDSSDAASLGFNKLFATVAVVALVAVQVL